MDLDTENRVAALVMEEARRLRLQADREGVGVYLREPKVRGRPNARFLTATVLGVQQANRAVEVNEMWRAREKELELDNRLSHKSKDTTRYGGERHHVDLLKESTSTSLKHEKADGNACLSQSSRKYKHRDFHSEDYDGLKDEDIEEFLQSRTKRGRGAIGSRMDEPGPYPVCTSSDQDGQLLVTHETSARDEWERRAVGPEKPLWLLTREQHREEPSGKKTTKADHASRSKKRRSDDEYTAEKSRKKRRKDKSRHHRKSC